MNKNHDFDMQYSGLHKLCLLKVVLKIGPA